VTQVDRLPYLDEHATSIAANPDAVWDALLEALDGAFSRQGAATFARIVGCADHEASGPRPLEPGSTIPGFRVVTSTPGTELVLAGRHRFSSYALTFRLQHGAPGRAELRAESRATFPGVAGGAYRLLVVRSGGHVVAVRRLLSAIRHHAEQRRH